jgi:hypothetical protein
MNYQFWIQQGTFQKHEAVTSGKKKHKVLNGTQHFQMFRETVKHCDHQSTPNSPVEHQDLWYTGSMIHDCHIIHS